MPTIVDSHVHLATDDEQRYPRPVDTPFTTHRYEHTVEQFVADMAGAGVRCATVVQPFGLYGSDNSYHADSAARFAARMQAVCGVDPTRDRPEQVAYWVTERRMHGVRINTWRVPFDIGDPPIVELVREATALRQPIVMLSTPRRLGQLLELASRFGEATFVLDHLGGAKPEIDGSYEQLAQVAPAHNVLLKITTEQLLLDDIEARLTTLIEQLGIERFLWGSNYPVTDLGGYAATVRRSTDRLSFLDDAQRGAVMTDNAMRVWPGLDPSE